MLKVKKLPGRMAFRPFTAYSNMASFDVPDD
jgi:hypothetical protein